MNAKHHLGQTTDPGEQRILRLVEAKRQFITSPEIMPKARIQKVRSRLHGSISFFGKCRVASTKPLLLGIADSRQAHPSITASAPQGMKCFTKEQQIKPTKRKETNITEQQTTYNNIK